MSLIIELCIEIKLGIEIELKINLSLNIQGYIHNSKEVLSLPAKFRK